MLWVKMAFSFVFDHLEVVDAIIGLDKNEKNMQYNCVNCQKKIFIKAE